MNTTYFSKIIFGCLFFCLYNNNPTNASNLLIPPKDNASTLLEKTWEEMPFFIKVNKGSNCENIQEEENSSASRSSTFNCTPDKFIFSACNYSINLVSRVEVSTIIKGNRYYAQVNISASNGGIVGRFTFSNAVLAKNKRSGLAVSINIISKGNKSFGNTIYYKVCPKSSVLSTNDEQSLRIEANQSSVGNALNLKVFPNPFSNSFNIQFNLEETSDVNIHLYNALGQIEAVLTKDTYTKGFHSIDYQNDDLAKGYYIIRYQDATGLTKIYKVMKL